MRSALLQWILAALSIWIVAQIVPGFEVDGALAALLAAVLIGLVNATVGFILKILTLPLTIVTFGLFLFVINALMIMLVSAIVPGFDVAGFWSALLGSIVLTLVGMVMNMLLPVAHAD